MPRVRAALALLALASGCAPASAPEPEPAPRESVVLAQGWRFRASDDLAGAEAPGFDDRSWEAVSVPHTWQRQDPRTYRAAWYRRRFDVDAAEQGRPLYLHFEGVAAIADVYLNGVHLGQHRGAYTRFLLDATPAVRPGENVLAVRVSNDPEDTADCLPSGVSRRQLYHVWGGITRKVALLKTALLHVDPTDHAASGVYLTPRNVTADGADLEVRVLVRNAGATDARFEAEARLLDPDGGEALVLAATDTAPAAARRSLTLSGRVTRPRLWGPGSPSLYRLDVELKADGRAVDRVSERVGFRDFRFVDGGFVLNGQPILLRGVSKHQTSERNLSAVSDEEIREDFEVLAELGVNTVRLAHYPHSDLAYRLADERGILVIAENGHSTPVRSKLTGDGITREMVRQSYNHPSIVAWSVGNESAYLGVYRYAELVRSEDPLRAITYASNTGEMRLPGDHLTFVAHNRYPGWYRGRPWDFEFKAYEMRFLSEAGGGSLVSTHTDYAAARHVVDEFEPEEYRQVLAEVHGQVTFGPNAAKVPLYLTWVFRDFPIEKYKGVLNTKGLVTGGGLRKDAFHLYRAFLRPDTPVVHITSQSYFLRRGDPANGVKVYSNRPALTLWVNGEDRGTRRNGEYQQLPWRRRVANVFYWPTPLRPGRNEIVARDAEGHQDRAVVYAAPRGTPWAQQPEAPIRNLRSSNPRSPAYFIQMPIREQWPFYYELDGTADNTFDRLPAELSGASWIATQRLSKPARRTALSFEAAAPVRVFVMRTAGGASAALRGAGFEATGLTGEWRDDALRLVPFEVLARSAERGEEVRVPAETHDYVVLIEAR
jgi:beta-galactosidase